MLLNRCLNFRQKNRDGLAWFARRASAWLLKKVKERKSVKGQALDETCKDSKNWKSREPGQVGTYQPECTLYPLMNTGCIRLDQGIWHREGKRRPNS